ncbi:MAG: hypothetical protein AB1758_06770, partial [Candidatus Eremiobacterota bacterium]
DVVPGTGLNFDPFTFGVMPVINWSRGTPLTGGASFTADARFGLNIDFTDELRGQLEFAAYTAQGDAIVDTYYGQPASYLMNPFTAISTITGGLAGNQPLNHRPFTRMALDHFWLRHDPSRTELTLGAFSRTDYDPIVYVPMLNPMAFGPKYLGSFGAQVRGSLTLSSTSDPDNPDMETRHAWMNYEVMGTVLPDRNGGVGGASYFNHGEGANLGFFFDEERAVARINFLHAGNDASGGAARQVGLITTTNTAGIPWVNPNGFFVAQLGAGPNTAGIGSTTDIRPVPMPGVADGMTLIPGLSNLGNVGPQDQTSLALSFRYTFEHEYSPYLGVEWGHTAYRPNKNSSYEATGNAFRVRAGAEFLEGDLTVDAEYVLVEPRYDPFVLQIPRVGGIGFNHWRPFDNNYYGNLYSLHDSETFPHNRQGPRVAVKWNFAEDPREDVDTMLGTLFVRYSHLTQQTTSLQDVRFSAGSLAPGTPNSPVLGFSPGFVDPAFDGFAASTFAPSGSNGLGAVLENPRGRAQNVVAGLAYKFMVDSESDSTRGVTPAVEYRSSNFFRNSSLSSLVPGPAGLVGENINFTDYTYQGFKGQVSYDVTDSFLLAGGYEQVDIFGHWDPQGTYGLFAALNGVTRFNNLDTTVHTPFARFNWNVTDTVGWDLDARYYIARDHIPASTFPAPQFPATNLAFAPQLSAHPFNWEGFQISSSFSVKF